MNIPTRNLEAILFAAGKPMTKKQLQRVLSIDDASLREVLDQIAQHLNTEGSGVRLFESALDVALVTNPDAADVVRDVLQKDVTGELTKPSIETLAIIAYRGPITKPELEQVRGVNCSLILRNLLIRGLIEEISEKRTVTYVVSMEFLQHMGYDRVDILPDYVALHEHALLSALMKQEG
ncbi:SMC-Scp complex subunit ScpB [Candidatus Uhrbacteria bacterium CG10_big_fil_rev_8_21_14_0_10_50_16]|uniref:SMC-Scp complex subunit ScpB n=1 Tax=Candidatus Uhrbacteria bacterium CG10_big_fil_rev_8_21_14_0_10_50_16 TaxID=1975039 RepID=A0A2H0RM52_9BACT|nr:MAG: SMC-Scp complex subunit ScpB [Candidatus Uhrbacteria bacterium CG10_big_fil_rev_8_21_14_0_10_50_16]